MPSSPSLLTVIAHARSGALDHAWRLFREGGFEEQADDPAVLGVRGRLLKDRALAAEGAERQGLYAQAAQAYGRAGGISGATYPLINAATLALLSGDAGQAGRRARAVLARLDSGEAEPDTPYYQAATRAEALLLLGDAAAARTTLTEAVALAPQAWEDHASTLQQFARILSARDEDAAWLDALRPPRSLHFGGHMALAPNDAATADAVVAVLESERIGFGFGALAAGADIVIAEALLARGAALHLTLSAPPAIFRATSVGPAWTARFDAVLAQAETVRALGSPDDPPHPLGVQLAAEAAMGAAILQARALASEAVQLIVVDRDGPATGERGGSAWMARAWEAGGLRRHRILAARAGEPAALPAGPPMALTAVLLVDLSGGADNSLTGAARLAAEVLPCVTTAIAAGPTPIAPPAWRGASVQLAYADPADAARAALAIVAGLEDAGTPRIAGAYGLAPRAADGVIALLGPTAALPGEMLGSVPPGAIHLTETFANALQVDAEGRRTRVEYVGDLPTLDIENPTRLFSLKAASPA